MAALQLLSLSGDCAVSYLVYCIVDGKRAEPRPRPLFFGYPAASIMVRAAGLGAVMSSTSSKGHAPDVARLLAYARVVESYNRVRSVIPMRYGCRVEGVAEVRGLLEGRRRDYLRLLADLDGRMEMSVRVVLDRQAPAHLPPGQVTRAGGGFGRTGPGMAYLAERGGYYTRKAELDQRLEEICGHIRELAQSTFVRWTSEDGTTEGAAVIVVHFLVPRSKLASFTAAVRPLPLPDGSLTITGPWPPYNFVRGPARQSLAWTQREAARSEESCRG